MSVASLKGTAKPHDTFPLLTLSDLEKLPPPEWLIEPLLMVDSQAILFGAPGEGKSFVALSFALCVATGRDWLGHRVKQGPVIYVAAEGGRGIRKRVQAWQKEHRIDSVESMFFLLEAPQLHVSKDLPKLLNTTAQLPKMPVLVVLDTLARTMVGGDENAAKDVGEWVEAARRLQEATKATVLTLHHTVKRAGKGKPVTERGSGALRGAADTMMAVTKKGGTLTLSCVKQKDGEEFEQLMLCAKEVIVETGEKDPQKSLVIVRGEATEEREATALSEAAVTALGLLAGIAAPRVTKREWKTTVDAEYAKRLPDKTFMNWVKELVDAGEVKRVKRGFYELKQLASASATEVPSDAIGKAA
jgi:hypothetical protein